MVRASRVLNDLMFSLAILLSFTAGYGDVTAGNLTTVYKTRDEERYLESAWTRIVEHCGSQPDPTCSSPLVSATITVMNERRKLAKELRNSVVFGELISDCEAVQDLAAQASCYRALSGLSYSQAMSRMGYRRSGVTMEGYSKLRIGMLLRDVEFILGESYEEVGYSSMGGSSAATYKWVGGRGGVIIVSFLDDVMRARAQQGIR